MWVWNNLPASGARGKVSTYLWNSSWLIWERTKKSSRWIQWMTTFLPAMCHDPLKMGSQVFNIDVHFLSNFYQGFLKNFSELHFCFGSLLTWKQTFLSSPELTKLFPWNALASLQELQCIQPCPSGPPAVLVTAQSPEGALACPLLLGCAAEADGCKAACSCGRRGLAVQVAAWLDGTHFLQGNKEKCAGPDATELWLGIRLWTTLHVKWCPPRLKQTQFMLLRAAGLCCCLIPRVASLRMETKRY